MPTHSDHRAETTQSPDQQAFLAPGQWVEPDGRRGRNKGYILVYETAKPTGEARVRPAEIMFDERDGLRPPQLHG